MTHQAGNQWNPLDRPDVWHLGPVVSTCLLNFERYLGAIAAPLDLNQRLLIDIIVDSLEAVLNYGSKI